VKRDESSRTAKPNPKIPKTELEERLLNQTQQNRALGRVPTALRVDSSEAEKEQCWSQAHRCGADVQVVGPAKALPHQR
jgi:hypothetical protein